MKKRNFLNEQVYLTMFFWKLAGGATSVIEFKYFPFTQ